MARDRDERRSSLWLGDRAPRAGLGFLYVALAVGIGCGPGPRPAPVQPDVLWSTHLGNFARAPFLSERVATEAPIVSWSAAAGSGMRGMPVLTDEVVITAAPNEHVYVLSRADGSELWSEKLDGPPSAPLVRGGYIYTATEADGKFYILELEQGDEVWDRDLPSVSRPIAMSGDTAYLATETGELVVLDAGERRELWRLRFRRRPTAGPLLVDSWVIFVTSDSLHQVNRQHGHRVRAIATGDPVVGELAADGERVYAATERGTLVAWRLPTLEQVWRTEGFEAFLSGPVIAEDAGYAASRSGLVVRFDTGDGTAQVIADARGTVKASPSIVQNGVLVGTLQGRLFFFGRRGERYWDLQLNGSVEAPVVVREGRLTVPMYGPVGGPLGTSPVRGKIVELQ